MFHIVFGKTVPDISLNAVANLGYADGRFLSPSTPARRSRSVSEVIGLKENSNRQTGVVYVRSTGFDRAARRCSSYCPLGDGAKNATPRRPRRGDHVPELPKAVDRAETSVRPARRSTPRLRLELAGGPHRFGDYAVGREASTMSTA